jgi:DNA-binding transcriptional regulator YbjK
MMSGGSGVGGVSQSATWSDAFSEARQGFCAQILSCIQRAMSADRGLLGQMSEQYMQKVSARELAKIMRDERPAADVWLEAVCGTNPRGRSAGEAVFCAADIGG